MRQLPPTLSAMKLAQKDHWGVPSLVDKDGWIGTTLFLVRKQALKRVVPKPIREATPLPHVNPRFLEQIQAHIARADLSTSIDTLNTFVAEGGFFRLAESTNSPSCYVNMDLHDMCRFLVEPDYWMSDARGYFVGYRGDNPVCLMAGYKKSSVRIPSTNLSQKPSLLRNRLPHAGYASSS